MKQYQQDVICQMTARYYATLFNQQLYHAGTIPFKCQVRKAFSFLFLCKPGLSTQKEAFTVMMQRNAMWIMNLCLSIIFINLNQSEALFTSW